MRLGGCRSDSTDHTGQWCLPASVCALSYNSLQQHRHADRVLRINALVGCMFTRLMLPVTDPCRDCYEPRAYAPLASAVPSECGPVSHTGLRRVVGPLLRRIGTMAPCNNKDASDRANPKAVVLLTYRTKVLGRQSGHQVVRRLLDTEDPKSVGSALR